MGNVREFAGRHNIRDQDTIDQMAQVVDGMGGKRLTYDTLTQPNGLSSGARGDQYPVYPKTRRP